MAARFIGYPGDPPDNGYGPSPLVEDVLGVLEDADVPTEINDRVVKLIEAFELKLAEQDNADESLPSAEEVRGILKDYSVGAGAPPIDPIAKARTIARSVRGCTTDAQYADLVVQIEDALRDALAASNPAAEHVQAQDKSSKGSPDFCIKCGHRRGENDNLCPYPLCSHDI